MKKWKGALVFVLSFLCFAGVVVQMLYSDSKSLVKSTAEISVVVYVGANNDRWRSLEQGIRQACIELGIEKPVITSASANAPGRQASLIQREVDNGAKGLLVISNGDDGLQEYLEALSSTIPIVMLENGAGNTLPCVSADNAQMGYEMAEYFAKETRHIAVLAENLMRQNVSERYNAFLSRMKELGKSITILRKDKQESDLQAFLTSTLATYQPKIDILVTLDNDSLESTIDALPAAMVEVELCGIGSSEKVVHALDLGSVNKIVFQNEYAIGYIGTMTLVNKMGFVIPPVQSDIQYGLAGRETMYDPQTERLLFPIIQ